MRPKEISAAILARTAADTFFRVVIAVRLTAEQHGTG